MTELERTILTRFLTHSYELGSDTNPAYGRGKYWRQAQKDLKKALSRLLRKGLIEVHRRGTKTCRYNAYRLTPQGTKAAVRSLDKLARKNRVLRAGPKRGQAVPSGWDAYGKRVYN